MGRKVGADPEMGLRDAEFEPVVLDPGELPVRQVRRRDSEPAPLQLLDPVDADRTELGSVSDLLEDAAGGRYMESDPLAGSHGRAGEGGASDAVRWRIETDPRQLRGRTLCAGRIDSAGGTP